MLVVIACNTHTQQQDTGRLVYCTVRGITCSLVMRGSIAGMHKKDMCAIPKIPKVHA